MIQSRKQMIQSELTAIIKHCKDTIELEQPPYVTIGRIQAIAERALGYIEE